jgi:hypothetical protein
MYIDDCTMIVPYCSLIEPSAIVAGRFDSMTQQSILLLYDSDMAEKPRFWQRLHGLSFFLVATLVLIICNAAIVEEGIFLARFLV